MMMMMMMMMLLFVLSKTKRAQCNTPFQDTSSGDKKKKKIIASPLSASRGSVGTRPQSSNISSAGFITHIRTHVHT
jgi:hypothetical protein